MKERFNCMFARLRVLKQTILIEVFLYGVLSVEKETQQLLLVSK